MDRGGKSSGGWTDDSWVSIPAWMKREERRRGGWMEGRKEEREEKGEKIVDGRRQKHHASTAEVIRKSTWN